MINLNPPGLAFPNFRDVVIIKLETSVYFLTYFITKHDVVSLMNLNQGSNVQTFNHLED